jgi:hypothetical protein
VSNSEVNKGINWMRVVAFGTGILRLSLMSTGAFVLSSMAFGTLPVWILATASVCFAVVLDTFQVRHTYSDIKTHFETKYSQELNQVKSAISQICNIISRSAAPSVAPSATQSVGAIQDVAKTVVASEQPVAAPAA